MKRQNYKVFGGLEIIAEFEHGTCEQNEVVIDEREEGSCSLYTYIVIMRQTQPRPAGEERDYVLHMVFIQCQKNHTVTTKATTYSKHYEQEETCLQSGSTDNEVDRITAGESSISPDQARNKARKREQRHEESDCCGTYHAEQEGYEKANHERWKSES